MTTAAPPEFEDPQMATACPMQLIAAVTVEEIKRDGVVADRRIQIVLDCGCTYDISLDLTIPAPRPGEPSHCRGTHG